MDSARKEGKEGAGWPGSGVFFVVGCMVKVNKTKKIEDFGVFWDLTLV